MNKRMMSVANTMYFLFALDAVEVESNADQRLAEQYRSTDGARTEVIFRYHQPFFATTRTPITLDVLIESTDTLTFGRLSFVDSVSYRRLRDQLPLNDVPDLQQGRDFRIVLIGPNEEGGLDTIAFNQTGGVLVNGMMYRCDNQLFFAMARMLPLEYQNSMLMVGQE